MSASIQRSMKLLLNNQRTFYRFSRVFIAYLGQQKINATSAQSSYDHQGAKYHKARHLVGLMPFSNFIITSLTSHSRRTFITKTHDDIYLREDAFKVNYQKCHTMKIHTSMVLDKDKPTKTCWKCGKVDYEESELFFCKCGVVQQIPEGVSYFQLFDLDEGFAVDLKELSNKYINLQKRLHPDKFTNASEEEKLLAEEQSALVNKAYSTLSKPLTRATYMLEMCGKPIEEGDALSDPEFLTEVMSINEDIADCSSPEDLKIIEKSNQQKIDMCIEDLKDAFRDRDINSAHDIVVRYQYYNNINNKIKNLQRSWMN